MSYDYIEIGQTPGSEDCAQVGSEDYATKAKLEIARLKELCLKKFGPPPEGAYYYTKPSPHDFGTYYELAIKFNEEIEDAVRYAYHVEENAPSTWDDDAPIDWRTPQEA